MEMTDKEMQDIMKSWEKTHEDRQKKFWSEEYPAMSFENKIIYWRKDVFNAMQFQTEQSGDPYSAFNKDWMDYHLAQEPDFKKILPEIVKRLSLDTSILNERLKK
jgi:hypothetical protein